MALYPCNGGEKEWNVIDNLNITIPNNGGTLTGSGANIGTWSELINKSEVIILIAEDGQSYANSNTNYFHLIHIPNEQNASHFCTSYNQGNNFYTSIGMKIVWDMGLIRGTTWSSISGIQVNYSVSKIYYR